MKLNEMKRPNAVLTCLPLQCELILGVISPSSGCMEALRKKDKRQTKKPTKKNQSLKKKEHSKFRRKADCANSNIWSENNSFGLLFTIFTKDLQRWRCGTFWFILAPPDGKTPPTPTHRGLNLPPFHINLSVIITFVPQLSKIVQLHYCI